MPSLDSPTAPLLAGALSGFALADVLQLLELGARSGTLAIDGGPLGRGAIGLGGGRIVSAELCGGAAVPPGDVSATVAALLDVGAGRWAFHAAEVDAAWPRGGEARLSVGAVLLEAARRRDERTSGAPAPASAAADVPTLSPLTDDGVQLDDDAAGCLTAAHLRVLAAVDGVRDLGAIAAVTRRDPARVRESVTLLRALGLVSAHVDAAIDADVE